MLPNSLIHAPNHPNILFACAPKCGGTSLRHWLYYLGTGQFFPTNKSIWTYFAEHHTIPNEPFSLPLNAITIAIHRDGPSRLISAFLYLRRLNKVPDFPTFLSRLSHYENDLVKYHIRHQTWTLGQNPSSYTYTLPTAKLDLLPLLWEALTGSPAPAFFHHNFSTDTVQVSREQLHQLAAWSAYDTYFGWDGERTSPIFDQF